MHNALDNLETYQKQKVKEIIVEAKRTILMAFFLFWRTLKACKCFHLINHINVERMPDKISVFWFRRDLRLHDNHALSEALSSGIPVLPIFIFDSEILSKLTDPKDARVSNLETIGKRL